MLYLVVKKQDSSIHTIWSLNPENDFADFDVIGEAPKDENGNYEPIACLVRAQDGSIVADKVLKDKLAAEAKKAREDKKHEEDAEAEALKALKRIKKADLLTIEALADVVIKIIKHLRADK